MTIDRCRPTARYCSCDTCTNLPRHCLMLVGRTTETVASYSCSLDSCNSSDLSLLPPILPRLPLRLLQCDFKYSSRANAIGLKSGLSGDALLSGFLVMDHAFGFVLRCYRIFTSSGLCFLSQSLSAAFMRVCQPLPVALNASTTSGEYRIFTDTFGQSVTGRPLRRKVFNWLYGKSLIFSSSSSIVSWSDFAALRIFASSSSEGSIVPGLNLSFDMAFNLPSVCLSQADNSAFVIVTVSKYNAVNTVIQIAESYKSLFPVIAPGIHPDNRRFPFEELSLSQRNTVLTLVDGVLVWIKGDFHVFIVATKNNFANCLHWLSVMSYAYPAPYKTGAGIETPKLTKATPDAASVFFVVRYMCHSMAWYAIQQRSYNRRSVVLLSYHAAHNGAVYCPPSGVNLPLLVRVTVISRVNSTSRRQRMVTLAGQPQGWPVPFVPGSLNPVNVTATIEIETSRGDSLTRTKEAA